MAFARLTFRARLLIIIGLATAATQAALVGIEVNTIERRVDREIESQAGAAARQGARSLSTAVWELNRDQAIQVLAGLALGPDFVSAVVTDPVGGVFARLGRSDSRSDSNIHATEKIDFANAGERRTIGSLTVTLSRDRMFAQQRAAVLRAALAAVVNIVTVFLAAFVGIYLITRPMEAIIAAMLDVGGCPAFC